MNVPMVLVIGHGPFASAAAKEIAAQGARAMLVRPRSPLPLGPIEGPQAQDEAEIVWLSGAPGDFRAGLRSGTEECEVTCGAVVMVPEIDVPRPAQAPHVVPVSQAVRDGVPADVARLAIVLGPHAPRSSFIKALECARRARALPHRPRVWMFAAEMCAYGLDEEVYRQAQAEGVIFVRTKGEISTVTELPLLVRAEDVPSGSELEVLPDLLILDDGALRSAVPPSIEPMSGWGVTAGHVSMGPTGTMREGVYLIASPSSDLLEAEALVRVRAAVTRAVSIALAPPDRAPFAVVVDRDRCSACLTCVRSCPFQAVRPGDEGKATVDAALCQACGVCVGVCPSRALSLPGDTAAAFSEVETKEGSN